MKITILTLFPQMFFGPFDHSILKRAKEKGLLEINFVNIRDFGEGVHKLVDDTPYGGGVGMVMRVDVVHRAVEHAKKLFSARGTLDTRDTFQKTVLLTASGKPFNQEKAQEFAKLDHLILICGHYEGIDERIKHFIDEEISVGDFVLTGGEIPTMLITDAVTRLLSGAITDGAADDESFSKRGSEILLEYPHFTKPRVYKNHEVPEILLSGNHAKIQEWKLKQALEKTQKVRPDLLKKSK